ncbi:MAG: hypothetical protein AAGE01_01370 [Pseudomonadota bacterium]
MSSSLRGQRFLPLTRADDGATLRAGRGPRREIVSRRRTPFHRISLDGIPNNRRLEAAKIQCGLLDPTGRARPWIVLRGDQALVWLVDSDSDAAVPESLDLVDGEPGSTLLVNRLEGFEAVRYDDAGALAASRYFPRPPSAQELGRFLRSAGLPAEHPVTTVDGERDWSTFAIVGRPLARTRRLAQTGERAVAALFIIALLFVAFQAGALLFETRSQGRLEDRIAELQEALAPALRWQSLATEELDHRQRLEVAVPPEDALATLAALSSTLRGIGLEDIYIYRSDLEELVIQVPAASERLPEVVKAIEDSPAFRAATGRPLRDDRLEIRFEREAS